MKLKSNSPKGREFSPTTGSRLRKKHKRLDAICENVYNRNHSCESNELKPESEPELTLDASPELRRSSRVRRAPLVLDASPPPVKKRKKIGRNVKLNVVNRNNGIGKRSVDKEVKSGKFGFLDMPGSWGWRLRSRARSSVRRERGETSRKRKLFDEQVETVKSDKEEEEGEEEKEEEEVERKEELDEDNDEDNDEDEKLMVLISKRPGRVKAVNNLGDEIKKNEDHLSTKDEIMVVENGVGEMTVLGGEMDSGNDVEIVQDEVEEFVPVLVNQINGGTEEEVVNVDAVQLGSDDPKEKEKNIDGICNVKNVKESDEQVMELETSLDEENEIKVVKVVEVDETLMNEGDYHNKEGNFEVNETPLEIEKDGKAENLMHDPSTLGRPRVKQGRQCGLCGCANDGKPPKRLMQNAGESENEAYSGSSASEEPNYDVWDGFGDEPGWLGGLLGPINDRYGIAGIWVHQNCAVWSPEVYFAGLGCLKNVRAALCRGKALKCTRCGRPGATIGCRVDRCPKTYHLPCARANGCIFDHRKFLIACTDHRHLFQPYGNKYLMRIKKLKARKMKLEIRKWSNDAWRKDVDAEEKWLENCGEDEEFLKRESKRLHRDLLRITPVYIGGSDSGSVKLFEGWESVAGLKDVIQCMKEVVILPLLYPEVFNNLGITPPRGVLLHGYPGTGKTLVVRALIGSCARGDKRIAYFARKGADCLGKYVGDAERQLRLLFQVAEKSQPSIIFFDEIDGLAPCRSRQQDQTHSSVVSTLLALMDGLKSRGSVVVIGATNRPEAVDPALRRPGRFDREIYFPLPSVEDRAAILSLHTQRWPKPVTGSLLQWVARRTVGFAGADLQALCTQAAIIALKRNFPLHAMLSAAGDKAPGAKLVPLPAFTVEERDWLEALACAPPPCSRREAGMTAHDLVTSPLPANLVPCLLKPLSKLLVSLYLDECLLLPAPLSKASVMVKSVIISNLEKNNFAINQWWFHVDSLLNEIEVVKEIQRRLSFVGIVEDVSCLLACPDESTNDCFKFERSVQYQGDDINLNQGISSASRKKSGYRILVAGGPRSGQKHIASCILHCFHGNVEIQKVDLATISQEGQDVVQGIARLLMKCASLSSSVIFMPRIDLWAVETCQQVTEVKNAFSTDQLSGEKEGCSTPVQDVAKQIVNSSEMFENIGSGRSHSQSDASEKTESSFLPVLVEQGNESATHQYRKCQIQKPQNATLIASHAWCSFVEQLEYISASTSLIILATSELPSVELPDGVKQFFESYCSKSSELTCLEHRVPRFMVNVVENFSCGVVVGLSTAKLLREIAQLFALLVHQKAHSHATSSVDHKFYDSIQACHDTVSHNKNDGSVVKNDCRKECPGDNPKVAPPPSNRSLKGKSNLLLAISTFGYQILRFPHFAELCWVTSKLKEGPCADVSGPWKGWPFNSCIIYPAKVDKVPATCSVGHIKSKERYGLVRGLVAVGLSAYRGAYKSLREVSFEVRKVLELLVGQVNENIQAGKDRYQYIRLLSQVAYLEDMVNSWAHALQSLEPDNQIKEVNANQNTSEFPHDHAFVDVSIQGGDSKEVTPDKSADDVKWLEGSPVKIVPENAEDVDLNGEANGICHSGVVDREVFSEDMSGEQIVHGGHSDLDENHRSSIVNDKLVNNKAYVENGTTLGQSEPENTGTPEVDTGLDNGAIKHSNGFAVTEVTNPEDGVCNSNETCIKSSSPLKSFDQIDEMVATEDGVKCNNNIHSSPERDASHSANSGVVCSYVCCSRCLYILQKIIQEILVHRWKLNSSCTADDIHDVVSSLSVDLLSAIRKFDVAGISVPGNLRSGFRSQCSELQNCHCESSGDLAAECCCHSADGCLTAEENSPGMELKFVFRDGVLVPLDFKEDVSFHCKYQVLCLCSIIKNVVMMREPSD